MGKFYSLFHNDTVSCTHYSNATHDSIQLSSSNATITLYKGINTSFLYNSTFFLLLYLLSFLYYNR